MALSQHFTEFRSFHLILFVAFRDKIDKSSSVVKFHLSAQFSHLLLSLSFPRLLSRKVINANDLNWN